jgi:branched-chain amino acid transport system substrate-binding protein
MKYRTLAALMASFIVAQPATAADTIKVGFLGSITGTWSILGNEQERGLEIAMQHLGGKLGGIPAEIIKLDDQSTPDMALQQAKKAIELDKVQIITGTTPSNVMVAVAKPIGDAGVFLVSGNAGPSPIAGAQCHENVFVASWQNDTASRAVGDYLSRTKKRVYFIGANYQAGWDFVNGAKSAYTGTVAGEKFVPLNTLDFSGELAQIRAARPDAVYAFMVGPALIGFVKQYDQAGLKRTASLHGGIFLGDDMTFKAQGDAALDLVLSTHWYPKMDNPASKKFVQSFREKYGRNPAVYAQQQYDAMMLIDSAVRAVKGNVEDKAAFRAALRKADFQSTRGKFRFNNNHYPIQDFYTVKVVKSPEGELEHELVGKGLQDVEDPYAKDCPMKWKRPERSRSMDGPLDGPSIHSRHGNDRARRPQRS